MRTAAIIQYFILAAAIGISAAHAQMLSIVNGASFNPGAPMAPGSFASMFGEHLCSETMAADWIGPGQLPASIGGCSVTVDGMNAMMHYVSPAQVNFIVPEGIGSGMAEVVMHNGPQTVQGSMRIDRAGPGVFALSSMGMGQGAMLHGTLWRTGPFSTTTNGHLTPVAIYLTGLDLTAKPVVEVGGVPVEVTWYGNAPGFVGLQQINITLPENMAGVGTVPLTVMSAGQTSNVTFMNILPTTAMMQGMPGWGQGMMVGENLGRGREMSYLAFNPANNTAVVTDEEDDALRVISLDSLETIRTITLPDGSEAHAVAVSANGTVAAVALSRSASVALINLQQPDDITILGTGNFPSHLAFTGSLLLVTNAASGTVSVIDLNTRAVTRTLEVGFGASGIAADTTTAVVANMQAGSVSVINLSDFSVTGIDLPAGTRPHEVALASTLRKAVITTPMSNGFFVLDLQTGGFNKVETSAWNAMGPGAVVVHNGRAYIANQMTASVTVADLVNNAVLTTFPVDPGPRALAIDADRSRLLVLSQGTGTLSVIDINSFSVVARVNATEGDRLGRWTLPTIASISPNSASRGATISLTITGSNLQDVEEIEFHFIGGHTGGMRDGMMGGGMGNHDENIKVTNLQVSADGRQITATVQILSEATPGTRRVGLETGHGEVMAGPMFNALFTVTE